MSWLITQTLEALNLEHVQRLYADKSKVKAYITGFPVNVAVDLDPDVARRMIRDIVDQVVRGLLGRGRGRRGPPHHHPALGRARTLPGQGPRGRERRGSHALCLDD